MTCMYTLYGKFVVMASIQLQMQWLVKIFAKDMIKELLAKSCNFGIWNGLKSYLHLYAPSIKK